MSPTRELAIVAVTLTIPLGLDLYMPVPDDNPIVIEKIAVGRRLFNDPRLSRDGTIACSSCHDPAHAFSTDVPIARGVAGRVGRRNAPALINRGYGRAFFWDARAATLEQQVVMPIQDPAEMDLTLDEAETRVGMDRMSIARALATYVRAILSGDSPFDRFVTGNAAALSGEQQRGLSIFRGKGNCTACHAGPTFSDERLHNTGVAWKGGGFADGGAGHGEFKTPTLREIARTAPYMHDGSIRTLDEVIDYYDRGGNANPFLDPELRPLGLSGDEKRDLRLFLLSLSGRVTDGER